MTEVVSNVNCRNCGAPLELAPGEILITCEFCGTTFNQSSDKAFVLKHSIVPNSMSKDDVKALVKRWMRGDTKPPNLAKASKFHDIKLTYLPFFVIDVKAKTEFKGGMTRTGGWIPREGVMDKEYFWKVLGRRATRFPTREYDIPISTKVNFDMSKVPQGSEFHNTELDESEAVSVARQEIESHHRFLLEQDVDSVDRVDTTFDVDEIEFLHAPVWEVRYEFKGKGYNVLVDGGSKAIIKGEVPPPDTSMKGFFGNIKRAMTGD